jgi:hypothetical protein
VLTAVLTRAVSVPVLAADGVLGRPAHGRLTAGCRRLRRARDGEAQPIAADRRRHSQRLTVRIQQRPIRRRHSQRLTVRIQQRPIGDGTASA